MSTEITEDEKDTAMRLRRRAKNTDSLGLMSSEGTTPSQPVISGSEGSAAVAGVGFHGGPAPATAHPDAAAGAAFPAPAAALDTALAVLGDEPELAEALAVAVRAEGMALPDLADVPAAPRFRRVAVLAEALEAHQQRKVGGPCSACGAVVPPRTRWNGGGYLTTEEPAFHQRKSGGDGLTALCSFCHDYLAAGHTTDDLREAVGNAIAGVASMPGPGQRYRFAHRALVPLFHEVEGGAPGAPWGHVTAVQKRAVEMLAEQTVHPRRFIRTVGAAERASLPGLPARVHDAPERPEYVAPVTPQPSPAAVEAQAMEKHHTAERDAWLAEHREWDEHGNPLPLDEATAEQWAALLARQAAERRDPSAFRARVGDAPVPAVERRAPAPTMVRRRKPTPEERLDALQGSERDAYLARHPRPPLDGQVRPWDGASGWRELLSRHEDQRSALRSGRGAELRALEARQAAVRDSYLRHNPRPRHGGDWAGAEGWASLLADQEAERRAVLGGAPLLAGAV